MSRPADTTPWYQHPIVGFLVLAGGCLAIILGLSTDDGEPRPPRIDVVALNATYDVDKRLVLAKPLVYETDRLTYDGLTTDGAHLTFRDARDASYLVDRQPGTTFTAYGHRIEIDHVDAATGTVHLVNRGDAP